MGSCFQSVVKNEDLTLFMVAFETDIAIGSQGT